MISGHALALRERIMKKLWWLSAMLAIALAMGCGDDKEDTPATDTATDSGADTTADGDGTAAADGAAATDAGTACLASPYTPTSDEATYFGKGCSEPADLQYLGMLQKDATKGDALRKAITDCLLQKGCSGKADTKAKEACTKDCIKTDAPAGIGDSCALCYAINGVCGFEKCIGDCAVDSGSDGCKKCLGCNCDPVLQACQQLPAP
jgi:hypothetical protein